MFVNILIEVIYLFYITRISHGPEWCQLSQLSLLLVEPVQTEQLRPGGEANISANIRLDHVDLLTNQNIFSK